MERSVIREPRSRIIGTPGFRFTPSGLPGVWMRWIVHASLLPAVLLGGCGFRLAGDQPLPPALQRVYIDTVQAYAVSEPPLEQALRARMRRRGAVVLSGPESGTATLRLTQLDEQRNVLSIGADGKAVEFELVTTVSYVLLDGDRILVPGDRLSASRDYSFSADQILAKEAEEARLQRFLQDQLAELLLLRLEATLASAPGAVPAP